MGIESGEQVPWHEKSKEERLGEQIERYEEETLAAGKRHSLDTISPKEWPSAAMVLERIELPNEEEIPGGMCVKIISPEGDDEVRISFGNNGEFTVERSKLGDPMRD